MKIWGNGSLIIQDILGAYTATFTNAQCKLSYKQQSIQNITIDTCIHRTNIKYRPYIDVVFTVCNGEQENFQTLMIILNQYYDLAGQSLVAVYPRFSNDNSQYMYYYCVLQSSNIQPQNYANTKAGQQIIIQFKGNELVYLPYFTSETSVYNMVNQSDDQYVDASDNSYIMYR